jgi:hypothetical protein
MSYSPPVENLTPSRGVTPDLAALVSSQARLKLTANREESEITEDVKMSVHQPNLPKRNPPPVKPPWSLNELQILLCCITLAGLLFSACHHSWDFENQQSDDFKHEMSFTKTGHFIGIVLTAL